MMSGSFVALVTPFTDGGAIDYLRLAEQVDWQIASGTDGLVVLGTTGESPTISLDEQKELVAFVVKQARGRVHVMAGAGSNNTQAALEKCLLFENLGVDSLLVITPYYNKTNDSGVVKHFESIADQVHAPIYIYNVPSRTGYQMPILALQKLAQHPNIAGIKEASGDVAYALKISPYLSENFVMFSGNDEILVPMLSIGATGVISVWANICPREVKSLVVEFATNPKHSLAIQTKYLELVQKLFIEANPIPLKYAMKCLGRDSGIYRLPLDEPSLEHAEAIQAALKEVGLL